jgi:antitoxin MazE
MWIPRGRVETQIKKWGNSAAVCIPATVLTEANIELNQWVDVREDRGRIVIEPLRRRTFAIRSLVKDIRADNLHDAIDTGPRAGREVW